MRARPPAVRLERVAGPLEVPPVIAHRVARLARWLTTVAALAIQLAVHAADPSIAASGGGDFPFRLR